MRKITIEKEIYKFNELEEDAKNKFKDSQSELFDCYITIEDFIEQVAIKYGIEIDQETVEYSGFWSQGDGATFQICLNNMEIIDYLTKTKQKTAYKYLLRYIYNNEVEICYKTYRVNYHYSHYNTFNLDSDVSICVSDPKIENRLQSEIENLRQDIEDLYKQLCKNLYKQLEQDYYANIEDKFLEEIAEGNNYEFYEDGALY